MKVKNYQVNQNRPEIDLYLCVVYQGPEYTPEMKFNYEKLQQVENLNLYFYGVEAGEFSHRHKKDIPDPVQIRWRDEYLKNVPVGSWLLVLDSDETIAGALGRIPDVLYMAQENDVDFCMITEHRSDFQLKLRPRFIYKRRQNMSYGGPTQKHDVIWTCEHEGSTIGLCPRFPDHPDICMNGYNYIEIQEEGWQDNSWTLDFLWFNHYKDGLGMVIFTDENTPQIPKNLIRLDDLSEWEKEKLQEVADRAYHDGVKIIKEDLENV